MPTYDPASNTYTLTDQEQNYTLQPADTDASIIGNTLDNILTGNDWGNAFDNALPEMEGKDTLIGGKGDDLYVLYSEAAGVVVTEQADEGEDAIIAHFNIDLKGYANVEHIVLQGQAREATGNDANNQLYGNDLANILDGGAGNDTLDGGKGGDDLIGGLGNDIYFVDDANDIVVENANEGTDTVISLITYSLVGKELEKLTLSGTDDIDGTGNDYNNALTGNDGINHLVGGKGLDTLDGGLGADVLTGGAGQDTYVVDDAGDLVVEVANEGTDIVRASISYTLTDFVEALVLTGPGNIDGTGNDGSNEILGNDHNNILDGKGGNDLLGGNKGDDVYIIDAGDTVIEVMDEGTDTIKITDAYTPTSYTLQENFENLTVTGTRDFTATGNELNNLLTGNGGANVLSGAAGNDTLDGGSGNDRLDGGTGTNTALFSGAKDQYVIARNSDGSITVTDMRADGDGTDTLRNIRFAQFGDQLLDLSLPAPPPVGGGSSGGGGSSPTPTGPADLTLIGTSRAERLTGGDGHDTLSGLARNDVLQGLSGNDRLDGGTGKDVLTGGAGRDTFVFSTRFSTKTNRDKITDFSVKDDTLWLDNALFKANKSLSATIKKGTEAKPAKLASKFFRLDKAKDKDDFFVYDRKKGVLSYDDDGSGSHKAVEIASLKKGLKLTYHDFMFI